MAVDTGRRKALIGNAVRLPIREKAVRRGVAAGTNVRVSPAFAAATRPDHVTSWLRALDGMNARLNGGASVADIGCGCGASTIVMAQAYPASRVVGFDTDATAIVRAGYAAARAGLPGRATFRAASAGTFPGTGYDLVTSFGGVHHDTRVPAGVAAHVRRSLAADGAWMIVEPFAGGQATESRLRAIVTAGGFTRFRRATQTPFNLVVEARP